MSGITVHASSLGVAPRVPAGGSVRTRLRLTRRGRLVLVSIAAAPLVAAALWFGLNSGIAAADNHGGAPAVGLRHVTVAPGDSLWQIAETVAPHDDPRDVISAIVDLNDLRSSELVPGQSLAIPPQYAK